LEKPIVWLQMSTMTKKICAEHKSNMRSYKHTLGICAFVIIYSPFHLYILYSFSFIATTSMVLSRSIYQKCTTSWSLSQCAR